MVNAKKRSRDGKEDDSASKKSKEAGKPGSAVAKSVGRSKTPPVTNEPRTGSVKKAPSKSKTSRKSTGGKPPVIDEISVINVDAKVDVSSVKATPVPVKNMDTSAVAEKPRKTPWYYKLGLLLSILLSATNAVTISLWMQSDGDFSAKLLETESELEDVKEKFFFKLKETRTSMTKECDSKIASVTDGQNMLVAKAKEELNVEIDTLKKNGFQCAERLVSIEKLKEERVRNLSEALEKTRRDSDSEIKRLHEEVLVAKQDAQTAEDELNRYLDNEGAAEYDDEDDYGDEDGEDDEDDYDDEDEDDEVGAYEEVVA